MVSLVSGIRMAGWLVGAVEQGDWTETIRWPKEQPRGGSEGDCIRDQGELPEIPVRFRLVAWFIISSLDTGARFWAENTYLGSSTSRWANFLSHSRRWIGENDCSSLPNRQTYVFEEWLAYSFFSLGSPSSPDPPTLLNQVLGRKICLWIEWRW